MNLDQMIAQVGKDLEWISFLALYCARGNFDKPICREFNWWALGFAGLIAALVVWWIGGRLSRIYRNWAHKRALAKVADAETMKKHVWSGYSPDATPGSEQRAQRSEKR